MRGAPCCIRWDRATRTRRCWRIRAAWLDALVAPFETVWQQATPLSFAGDRLSADEEISADYRHLLSLLVAGLTDAAVGARIRLSRRTVVRRVQQLTGRTNSRSRMQLGWQARERGWLGSP